MFVVKRDGRTEPVHFDKITARITKLSYGLNPEFCDPVSGRGAGVARRARGCSRAPAWPRGGGGGRGGARARPQITRAACLNVEPGAKLGGGARCCSGRAVLSPPPAACLPSLARTSHPVCPGGGAQGTDAGGSRGARGRALGCSSHDAAHAFPPSLLPRSSSPKKWPPASTRASPPPSWTSWRPRRRPP